MINDLNPATKPRFPEIGEYIRGTGRLIAVVDSEPTPPPPKDYIFEEITAHCELWHNDRRIDEFCSVWDAYGLEESVKEAVKVAQKYAINQNIGADSPLEVRAVKVVQQIRKRVDKRPFHENFYDKSILPFEPLRYGCRYGMPDEVKTIVWSSKTSVEAKP